MLKILKNFSLTLLSSLVSLLTSAIIVLIIPKLIGVREYGFWQFYNLLASYVGVIPIGWIDGMFLKLGGKRYRELEKGKLKTEFIVFMIAMGVISLIVLFYGLFISIGKYRFITIGLGLTIFVYDVRTFISFVLQATNRITENAIITFISSILYLIFTIILLLLNVHAIFAFIFANILSITLSLIYALIKVRDIFQAKSESFESVSGDILDSIRVGIKLLISNFSGMLLLGIVRMGIERAWSIETFGKVSLALSLSNMMMVFITAISMVMFPILRRVSDDRLGEVYSIMRVVLMTGLFTALLAFIPLKILIVNWLPKYFESLYYLPLMLTTVVLQGKFELLSNTFFKVYRMEFQLLVVNVLSFIASALMTAIFAFFIKNLSALLVSVLVVMLLRSWISEIYLTKHLKINLYRDQFVELFMIVSYVLLTWGNPSNLRMLFFVAILVVYLLIERNNLVKSVRFIKKFRNYEID